MSPGKNHCSNVPSVVALGNLSRRCQSVPHPAPYCIDAPLFPYVLHLRQYPCHSYAPRFLTVPTISLDFWPCCPDFWPDSQVFNHAAPFLNAPPVPLNALWIITSPFDFWPWLSISYCASTSVAVATISDCPPFALNFHLFPCPHHWPCPNVTKIKQF